MQTQDNQIVECSLPSGELLPYSKHATAPPRPVARRAFLRRLGLGAAILAPGSGLIRAASIAKADPDAELTMGDVAILRFLAAAEIIETDLWQQYTELGGQDSKESGYRAALEILDEDQPQYISDNTEDEKSHVDFLNSFLSAAGAPPVNLDRFRTLPGSQATGAQQIGRLTNLMELTIDTSWWRRYRSNTNPDLGAMFPHAVPSLAAGLHTAIPRNDDELGDPQNPSDHIKAIAFTAGFHFGFIEQGGVSLYAAMARKVTNLTALEVVLGIGGAEVMHFQTWQDKAGNATPLTDHDAINNSDVTFEDLHNGQPAEMQANLIMPEPCQFIDSSLPPCSVIRPIGSQQVSARGAIAALTADGLFRGQSPAFRKALDALAQEADAASRGI
jgi:hypothetical protein